MPTDTLRHELEGGPQTVLLWLFSQAQTTSETCGLCRWTRANARVEQQAKSERKDPTAGGACSGLRHVLQVKAKEKRCFTSR